MNEPVYISARGLLTCWPSSNLIQKDAPGLADAKPWGKYSFHRHTYKVIIQAVKSCAYMREEEKVVMVKILWIFLRGKDIPTSLDRNSSHILDIIQSNASKYICTYIHIISTVNTYIFLDCFLDLGSGLADFSSCLIHSRI